MTVPWDVRVALAFYDQHGWRAVPPHLLQAVQMMRHGYGCVACSRPRMAREQPDA